MPSDKFLDELKIQYEREFAIWNNVDSKANSTIAMSVTISAFLLTFATFLLTGFHEGYYWLGVVKGLLIFGIVAGIASILLATLSYIVKEYWIAFGHEDYYIGEKPNIQKIDETKIMNSQEFENKMINDYLDCNMTNSKSFKRKVKFLKYSQFSFLVSVSTILFIMILLVNAVNANQFSFMINGITR